MGNWYMVKGKPRIGTAPGYEVGADGPVGWQIRGDGSETAQRLYADYPPEIRMSINGDPQVSEKVPTEMRKFPVGFDSLTDIAATTQTAVSTAIQAPFRGLRLVIDPTIAIDFFIVSVFVGTGFQGAATINMPGTLFLPESLVPLELDTAQVGNTITVNALNRTLGGIRFAGGMIGNVLR